MNTAQEMAFSSIIWRTLSQLWLVYTVSYSGRSVQWIPCCCKMSVSSCEPIFARGSSRRSPGWHLLCQRPAKVGSVVFFRHQIGIKALFAQLLGGTRTDGSKAQVHQLSQIHPIFLQLLKEDAHPSDAGEGNPTVAFQMFERGFERLVFLIRLQRDGRAAR